MVKKITEKVQNNKDPLGSVQAKIIDHSSNKLKFGGIGFQKHSNFSQKNIKFSSGAFRTQHKG